MASPHLTSQFADLIDPRFRSDFWGEYAQYTQVAPQIFNVEGSKLAYEKTTGVSGFGNLVTKDEGGDVTYDISVQLDDKTYTHVTHALGFKISQEMIEDDQTAAMRRRPKALAQSVAQTRETLAAAIFNDGFGDTGPDGVSLFDASHTGYGAATHSNLSSAAAISHSGVQAARISMMKTLDHRGQFIRIDPKMLLVPVDIGEDAFIITKTERVPGSANWDKNIIDNKGMETLEWRFLTDVNAWFILAPKNQTTLRRFDRIMPQFSRDSEFDTDVAKWKVRMRIIHGYDNWRGTIGNEGA